MRLNRIETRSFEDGRPFSPGRSHRLMEHYIHDITGQYGLALRPGHLLTRRNSYAEMAAAVLEDLGPVPVAMDVVAIASAVPDADLVQSPIAMLADMLPGDPLPLGVGDQGAIAPFTALGLIALYDPDNALLMVMDQRSLPYDVPGPSESTPREDRVVALLFTEDGRAGDGFAVRHWMDVAPEQASKLLAGALEAGTSLIAGRELAMVLPSGFPVLRVARPGRPCTGAWVEFAAALPGLRGRRAAVAEYDHARRLLSICTLDIPSEAQ
ncbi:hypothetical protein [Nonomuraea sp. 10N515B]|uniref:hypothetical protein n=1 Tax=Nonomuraea sp. 10N515B TaxID=3457422 RepID=UPI003FCEDE18